MRILFVEDDDGHATRLTETIAGMPYQEGIVCTRAISTAQALEFLKQSFFEVIVLGQGIANDLGDDGGLLFCRALRRAKNMIPILYVGDDHELLNSGADGWYPESEALDPDVLDARLTSLIRRSDEYRF